MVNVPKLAAGLPVQAVSTAQSGMLVLAVYLQAGQLVQHYDSHNAMLLEAVWHDRSAAPFVIDACEDPQLHQTLADTIDWADVSWLCKVLTGFPAEVTALQYATCMSRMTNTHARAVAWAQ